jgi:hypothetical protein
MRAQKHSFTYPPFKIVRQLGISVEFSFRTVVKLSNRSSKKVRAPLCLNAPAARTYLPIILMKTKLVLAVKSKMEIARALKSAMDRNRTTDARAECDVLHDV